MTAYTIEHKTDNIIFYAKCAI